MATRGAKAFIDTNVLIRANNPSMEQYLVADHLIKQAFERGYALWISRQVIREYVAFVSRQQGKRPALDISVIERDINEFERLFHVADESREVTRALIALVKEVPTGGEQIHDANIVATMLVHEIDTLLTFNVDDMKRFSPKVTFISSSEDFPQDNVVE